MKKKFIKPIYKNKSKHFRKMLIDWRDSDIVKAGWICHYVEKNNEAFIRGWRYALYSVISKLDDFNL